MSDIIEKKSIEELLNKLCNHIFKQLNSGYPECIYQKCLSVELQKHCDCVESEKHVPIKYTDTYCNVVTVGDMRIDIFIQDTTFGNVLLELKATKTTMGEDVVCQVNRYNDMLKKNYNIILDEAYIINFPAPSSTKIPEDIIVKRII